MFSPRLNGFTNPYTRQVPENTVEELAERAERMKDRAGMLRNAPGRDGAAAPLMDAQQPWLSAQDLRKIKPSNSQRGRRRSSLDLTPYPGKATDSLQLLGGMGPWFY